MCTKPDEPSRGSQTYLLAIGAISSSSMKIPSYFLLKNKHTLYGQKYWDTYSTCSGMETCTMKLLAHSHCADVNVRGDLELGNY